MEIAVYGGTFNPPTLAHEAIFAACLDVPGIDELWVMPSGERADKQWETSDEDRLAMLGLIKQTRFNGDGRLRISDFELEQGPPTETWRTTRALEAAFPEENFWLVFGADSYADMPNWRGGSWLQQVARQLVIPRVGYDMPAEDARLRHLYAELPEVPVSSTGVRTAVAETRAIDTMVSEAVADYIATTGLYRCATMR